MYAILLPFNHPWDLVNIKNDNLDDYYRQMDCDMVETITFRVPNSQEVYILWFDKDGKLKPCPRVNQLATHLLLDAGVRIDSIFGKCLITKEGEDSKDVGITKEDAQALCAGIRKHINKFGDE